MYVIYLIRWIVMGSEQKNTKNEIKVNIKWITYLSIYCLTGSFCVSLRHKSHNWVWSQDHNTVEQLTSSNTTHEIFRLKAGEICLWWSRPSNNTFLSRVNSTKYSPTCHGQRHVPADAIERTLLPRPAIDLNLGSPPSSNVVSIPYWLMHSYEGQSTPLC